MSVGIFLLLLVLAVAALMLTIIRFKIHPVISIFLVTFGLAVALGNSPVDAISMINQGFGNTLAAIGVVIIMGSIIAMGIQDTGAATSIANYFIKLTKGKNVELAPSLAAFVLSIPVFGDITMILISPIANILSHRKNISMGKMASFTGLGLFLTHSLVPPTPGILAITISMGADLGQVILWGTIISLITFFIVWMLIRNWTDNEYIPPKAEFIQGEAEVGKLQTQNSLLIDEKGLPPVWHAFLPLLIPVVLISLASFGKALLPKESFLIPVIAFLGDRVVSLVIGVIFAMTLVLRRQALVREKILALDKEISPAASLCELLMNSWVKRALAVAIVPLLVTAMGGAFGNVLSKAPAAKSLAAIIAQSNIMPVIVPWIIGVAMMTTVGSITMAQLTAAALVTPILPELGISPLVAVLAAGAGAMSLDHVNNSGFWVMCGFYNMNPRQGLKYITIPSAIASVVALILIIAFMQLGLLK